jgi:hypothetical protein
MAFQCYRGNEKSIRLLKFIELLQMKELGKVLNQQQENGYLSEFQQELDRKCYFGELQKIFSC